MDDAEQLEQLVTDLRRHQAEVATQNEELRSIVADLDASKSRYAELYDRAPVGYCTLDDQRIVIEANLSLADMVGVDRAQLIGQPFERLVRPEDQDVWYLHRQAPTSPSRRSCELRLRTTGDEPLWVLVSSTDEVEETSPPLTRVTLSDISARVAADDQRDRMREHLEQAARMESIGRLTGGVAHDFNNMLGVIIGNVELALTSVDATCELHARLDAIHDAALRSAALTGRLLLFSRRHPSSPERVDLTEVVRDSIALLRRLIRSDVEISFAPGPDAAVVLVDRTQLDQVLMNLCINAAEAIDEAGVIVIETGTTRVDDSTARLHRTRPGPYVTLTVRDTGRGMTGTTLAHVFEPFYTTKENGAGGLGLATVHGMAAQHEGFVTVSSVLGEGTSFTVHLPAVDQVDGAANASGDEWRRGESNP